MAKDDKVNGGPASERAGSKKTQADGGDSAQDGKASSAVLSFVVRHVWARGYAHLESHISAFRARLRQRVTIEHFHARKLPFFRSPDATRLRRATHQVVGASGDLAKKKIFPALFALFYEGSLPKRFTVMGFARSKMSDDEFRELISGTLTCRIDHKDTCAQDQTDFLKRCFYTSGLYDSEDSFKALASSLVEHEGEGTANRVFYMSVPPTVFVPVAQNAAKHASSPTGYTRVIIEKPFGRDLASARKLGHDLSAVLREDQIYRIDHYLGKELVENLTVLRFSNLVFSSLWNRENVKSVQIVFSENFGTEGRGGYFDRYGIIRDIMQNHLTQVLALVAMEQPVSMDAEDVRDEKVKLLRCIQPIRVEDVVVGQYAAAERAGGKSKSYLDDPTVPKGSKCPTFAAVALRIDNPRWDGVPFLMKAGKALDKRYAEVRLQFRPVPGSLYRSHDCESGCLSNELVIRIQPDESIYLTVNNKAPGLGMKLDKSHLCLPYKTRYGRELPDAYERLILDVVNGDKRLFIRNDELETAWKLFTPLLEQLEDTQPELYPYGSLGPSGAAKLAARFGVRWGDLPLPAAPKM